MEKGFRKEDLYSTCAVCKKIEVNRGSGNWEHIHPVAYETLGKLGELSHGYCPDCFRDVMAEIEEGSELSHPSTIEERENYGF